MSAFFKLKNSIQEVLFSNRDGSHGTQGDRREHLLQFAKDLIAAGYKLNHVQGLKPKHITAVIERWQNAGLKSGTLKNRTASLRYLARKINKPDIVPSNNDLQIPLRHYKPQFNRAIFNPDFSQVTNPYVRASLHLQRVFGLRREESIKIRPHQADQKNVLYLQPSWCKGGRGRSIPINTEEQRYWLEQAKALVKRGNSLIPPKTSYIKHRNVYSKHIAKAGLKNLHGLRHAFAQQCYKELTGWEAPINGGPTSKELTPEQKEKDYEARMIISEILGHSRIAILTNYCA